MTLGTPISFREAMADLARKKLMPTGLNSAQLKQLGQSTLRQAFFSARTLMPALLQSYKDAVQSILDPTQAQREGQPLTVTEGLNPATARAQIKELLARMGYRPDAEERGTIEDLSSDARINLVLDTNTKLAQSAGHLVQANADDVVDLWPAWEFLRFEDRAEPRNWPTRWRIAAETAGDAKSLGVLGATGRMVALKSSGLWDALGDGAGGYDDTLGDGRLDPVAFRTGMGRLEIDRDECEQLGLLAPGEEAKGAPVDLANIFGTPEERAA